MAYLRSGFALFVVALLGVVSGVAAQNVPPQMLPQEGPDVPSSPLPAATVKVLEADHWAWTEELRERTFVVPTPPSGADAWQRIILVVRIQPVGDPWDRLFIGTIGPAEVLHGTTPRADMTVRREVTEYASLLVPGQNGTAGLYLSSWDGGGLLSWVTLEFHDDPSGALVEEAGSVVSPFRIAGLCGTGLRTTTVTFPAEAPTKSTVELYLSGHGAAEFWWQSSIIQPRHFEITVDGVLVGRATALPYIYAFLGFYGTPGLLHGPMWWTAQQALDIAGVHTGVGEIPPYRVSVDDDALPMLTGNRTVGLRSTYGGCVWIASVNFLLD